MFRSRNPRQPKKSILSQRHDRIVLAAVVVLMVLALGLIPLYFLATAPRNGRAVLARLTPTPTVPSSVLKPAPTAIGQPSADPTTEAQQTPVPIPTVSLGDQRFAILLLGYGGGNHDGAYLTDSMMVVIVDPSGKTLTLVSLPRDSWVPLLFDGTSAVYNKVNTAYAFAKDPTLYPDRLEKYTGGKGAGTFASDTVSRLLGVPITYYVGMDFDGFRQMINAVGGVDVDVPTGFAARYPVNDDPQIDASWTIVTFNSGIQHMDGERAIEYARARETIDNSGEGSDFARSRRQRLIIEAFKTRLMQPGGLVHLPQLLGIASQHVDTNYAIPAIPQLAQLALDWKDVKIYQTALTADNYLEEGTGPQGTYLLVPASTDHSWAQIRAFMRHVWENPAAGVAMAATNIVVENDSGAPGLAERVSEALSALGYQVDNPVTGSPRAQTEVLDGTGGQAGPEIEQLRKDLGLKTVAVATPVVNGSGTVGSAAPATDASRLILQLGADAADLTLTVPDDSQAPSSTVGVVSFGAWSPDAGQPTPAATTASVSADGNPTPVPEPPTPTPRPFSARATPIPVANNPNVVVVPNLVGLPEAEAERVITQSDLQTTYVNYQTSGDVPNHKFFLSIAPGAVLSQQPPAGTQVSRGTKIALAVRKR